MGCGFPLRCFILEEWFAVASLACVLVNKQGPFAHVDAEEEEEEAEFISPTTFPSRQRLLSQVHDPTQDACKKGQDPSTRITNQTGSAVSAARSRRKAPQDYDASTKLSSETMMDLSSLSPLYTVLSKPTTITVVFTRRVPRFGMVSQNDRKSIALTLRMNGFRRVHESVLDHVWFWRVTPR